MNVKSNSDLLYQVVRGKILNKKRPVASSKDRSEVSGGGKKPWPQKGTGRSRHGSIRSPLFRGGGITFGPRKERNYKKNISKAIASKALFLAVEGKRASGEIKEVAGVSLKEYKTKYFAQWLKAVADDKSALVIVATDVEAIKRAGRNVPRVAIRDPHNFDVVDVVKHRYFVITKDASKQLEERMGVNPKLKTQKSKLQVKS